MRFGSLCSGIEAASVALCPIGWEAAWFSEVDVQASAVLAHRFGATAPIYPLDPDERGLSVKERKDRLNAIKATSRIAWRDRITNWGDISKLPELIRNGEVEAPEAVVGGPPCQAFSIAGLRNGLEDDRGNLTLTYVDIIDAVDDVRSAKGETPCVALYENVPGIFSDKTNAFGHLLAGLAGEDCPLEPPGGRWKDAGCVLGPKRAIAWRSLDAQFFHLPQRRKRVFVVASAMEGFDPLRVLLEFDGLRRDSPPSRETRQDVTHPIAPCLTGSGRGVERTGDPRGQDPVVAHAVVPDSAEPHLTPKGYRLVSFGEYVDDEVASTMLSRDYKYVTDIVVDQQGASPKQDWKCPSCGEENGAVWFPMCEWCGHEVQPIAYGFQPRIARNGRGDMGELVNALTAQAGETGKGDAAPCVAVLPFDTTQVTSPYNASNPQWGDPCHALARGGHAPTIAFSSKDYGGDAAEELSPTLRAMSHSGSHPNAGGQVAVCVTGDISHTLTAEGFDGSEDGTGRGNPIVVHGTQDPLTNDIAFPLGRNSGQENVMLEPGVAVRRLMPVECERLQGFPDFWTDVPIGNKPAADGPRYKQLGNSWAVPVVSWVGARIAAELKRVKRERDLSDII